MLARHVAAASWAVLALAGCDEKIAKNDSNMIKVRLDGDGQVGQACEAQSQCGYRKRCVFRGKDVMAKTLVVHRGVCEADVWPGGCFASLPQYPLSHREKAKAANEGRQGLPVQVVCH